MKRTITTLIATTFAALAIAVGAGAAAADPCTMPVPTGTAPCPPPIVSTSGGDSIGGDANTEPINMRDLADPNAPTYKYEAPTYFDDDTDEPTDEPTDDGEDSGDTDAE
ncbi:membrane protein [Gordonia phage Hans]|uniref:Membrane protein n=1 Tax=Gordonia Phage Phauci TaxID=2951392 RepID=A0A9E7NJQ4_9CAUD|nr:membrane protein [Gordonia phage Hans]UTN93091.1 membrane protein [Gordonia Phage Phauci]